MKNISRFIQVRDDHVQMTELDEPRPLQDAVIALGMIADDVKLSYDDGSGFFQPVPDKVREMAKVYWKKVIMQ